MKTTKTRGRMVEVIVRYWTNGSIRKAKPVGGKLFAWDSGEAYIKKCPVNGIRTTTHHFFKKNETADAVAAALADAGVVLVTSE